MIRFLAGLLVGVLVGGGGTYVILGRKPAEQVAAAAPAADAGVADPNGKKKKGKGRPGGGQRRLGEPMLGDELVDEPAIELSAADQAIAAEGDALKPRAQDLDLGAGGAEVRALTTDEINSSFAAAAPSVTDCITQARGAAPVNGQITVGLIVGPDGRVLKARVEAPAYLLHHGLYRCVRREVSSLRFPAVGRDSLVTVPFNLQ